MDNTTYVCKDIGSTFVFLRIITLYQNQTMMKLLPKTTLLVFTFISSISFSQSIDTAFVYRIQSVWQGEGKSLDVTRDANGSMKPVLATTSDFPNQHWRISKDKYGNFRLSNIRVNSKSSVECLPGDTNNKLILGNNRDVASQVWKISKNTDGSFRITSLWQGTGKALDVINDGTNNELQMANTANVSGQMWKFTKLYQLERSKPAQPSIGNVAFDTTASYRFTTAWLGEGKSLGVKNGMPSIVNSAEELNQYWKVALSSNGFYRITNRQEKNKSIDIINDGKANNMVTLAATNSYSGQYWKIVPTTNNTYRLTSMWQGEGKSLDILNDGKNNNTLIVNQTGNYSGQLWKLSKQTILPPPIIIPSVLPQAPPQIQTTPIVKDRIYGGEEIKTNVKIFCEDQRYYLIQQGDGNLVLYNVDNTPRWATGTNGKKVVRCIMQNDGNLVQYGNGNEAIWASGTNGNDGAFLWIQSDGNLVIYSKDKMPIWSSNTSDGGK